MSYLSLAPHGLREALITGGLPPLGPRIDEVYRHTYRRALERSRRYYSRHPRDLRRRPRAPAAPGARGRPPALRRPADGAPAAHAGQPARHERRRGGAAPPARAAAGLPRLPARRRRRHGRRAQPPLRRAARGLLGRRRRARPGPPSACCPTTTPASRSSSRPSTSSRGCSRRSAPWRRCARPPACSPSGSGRDCTTRSSWPPTRSPWRPRSMPTTSTCRGSAPRRRPPPSRGLRPWLTSEFEHNGLRAAGDRILGHLLDLVRGRA